MDKTAVEKTLGNMHIGNQNSEGESDRGGRKLEDRAVTRPKGDISRRLQSLWGSVVWIPLQRRKARPQRWGIRLCSPET